MNPFVLEGLMCGDGWRSSNKNILTITTKDQDYYTHRDVKVFLRNKLDDKHVRIQQSYPSEILTFKANRVFPAHISIESKRNQKAFLRGLYSANGYKSKRCIGLCQASYSIIEGVASILNKLGFSFSIECKQPSIRKLKNGKCIQYKKKYEIHIYKTRDRQKFLNTIGFLQRYKNN